MLHGAALRVRVSQQLSVPHKETALPLFGLEQPSCGPELFEVAHQDLLILHVVRRSALRRVVERVGPGPFSVRKQTVGRFTAPLVSLEALITILEHVPLAVSKQMEPGLREVCLQLTGTISDEPQFRTHLLHLIEGVQIFPAKQPVYAPQFLIADLQALDKHGVVSEFLPVAVVLHVSHAVVHGHVLVPAVKVRGEQAFDFFPVGP